MSDTGDWMNAYGTSGLTGNPLDATFPGGTEQDPDESSMMARPISLSTRSGGPSSTTAWGPKPDPATYVCDSQDGQHPKTLPLFHWSSDSGCPNWWAVNEGAQGQPTAFQTNNDEEVGTFDDLYNALVNGYDNSDAAMIEIYEERLWDAEVNDMGLWIRAWNSSFKQRRPPPLTYEHVFWRAPGGGSVVHNYIHGSKCTTSGQRGTITVN